jgi:hypothetical protein
MVLLVRSVIFKSVFLNRFFDEGSLFPIVGKRSPFFIVVVICLSGMVVVCLGVGGWCGWIRKALLCMMLQIVSSVHSRAGCMRSVCCTGTLWQRICVGLGGWNKGYVMCESGFSIYMDVFQLVGVLRMVMSR